MISMLVRSGRTKVVKIEVLHCMQSLGFKDPKILFHISNFVVYQKEYKYFISKIFAKLKIIYKFPNSQLPLIGLNFAIYNSNN